MKVQSGQREWHLPPSQWPRASSAPFAWHRPRANCCGKDSSVSGSLAPLDTESSPSTTSVSRTDSRASTHSFQAPLGSNLELVHQAIAIQQFSTQIAQHFAWANGVQCEHVERPVVDTLQAQIKDTVQLIRTWPKQIKAMRTNGGDSCLQVRRNFGGQIDWRGGE